MPACGTVYWMRRMVLFGVACSLLRRTTAFSVNPSTFPRASSTLTIVHQQRFMSSAFSADDFIQMQSETSSSSTSQSSLDNDNEQAYLNHQQSVFDEMSTFFASDDATPPEVVPVMQCLARSILQRFQNSISISLMDVGCGTGALFPFYLEAASDLNITSLEITGVDLSPKMAALSRERATRLVDDNSITVVDSDFVALMNDKNEYRDSYDAVVANACFGNFFDTDAILSAMASCLKVGGMLFITHPLGADFVKKLHEEDPGTVPHLLPTRNELTERIETTQLPLKMVDWQEQDDNGNPMYLAGASKTPYQPLPQVLRFRGTVDSGYGRGGKKLGFPTANLPESLFGKALEDVSTGVYFGWAVVEGRVGIHKAAVNVGFSPTFEGKENVEKIIEAHLIPDEPIKDFYGEPMRLALCGFLRPERKFDSFPELMEAITLDVENAKEALDVVPYVSLRDDLFLTNTGDKWVGSSGGDETASWEFEEFSDAAL